MTRYLVASLARRAARVVVAALAIAALSVIFAHTTAPAKATVPAALQLVEHALASSSALEDESPYQLIDPVGPGGITQKQAAGEVMSSTMQGGLYNNNGRYSGGGYGQQYLIQAEPGLAFPHGYGAGHVHPGGWPR